MPFRPRIWRSAARARALALTALAAFILSLPLVPGSAVALPVSRPPRNTGSPSPSPSSSSLSQVLPFQTQVLFVLDDPISSATSKNGDLIHMHLKNPIVVDGRVAAPAGTPGMLRVVDTSAAQIADVYGFVDIYVMPLRLPNGRDVPLTVATTRLTPRDTAGHESTVQIEDVVEDIVVPYAGLYQIFRKGKNFKLEAGAELQAQLGATLIAMPDGSIAIETPRPFVAATDAPRSSFTALPVAQPMGKPPPPPTVGPRPTPVPTPTPVSTPTPVTTPTSSITPSPISTQSPLPSATPSISPTPSKT